jgi:serine/threonine protein kinase
MYELDFYATYELGKELGSGAFSVVKLCTHKVSKNKYAVKVINKASLQEDDAAALLVEIKILKDLNHPNIIKYVLHCMIISIKYTHINAVYVYCTIIYYFYIYIIK